MLIIHATALLNGQMVPETCVRTADGLITAVGPGLQPLPDEKVIDAGGKHLLPGFVDVHIHAYRGQDTMYGEAAVRAMSRGLAELGVAAFLPTTMSASPADTAAAVRGIRAVMERPEAGGAAVLGAHMEAPFLQVNKCGAQLKEFFTAPSMEKLEAMTDGDPSPVRLITIAPELEGSAAFIEAATARGITVSIGHTDATAAQVHEAADHGANHITHTFNAQTPLAHREPGVPGAAMVDPRIYCEMICDCFHLHPDVLKLLWMTKRAERAVVVTDAMEAAGMPDGEYALGGQPVFVRNGQARLGSGVIAGSVLTMPAALRNLIHRVGIPAADAATMCTATPAASIGEKRFGVIAAGSPAFFTLWDEGWENFEVIRGDAE